jgi:hypothetical protein
MKVILIEEERFAEVAKAMKAEIENSARKYGHPEYGWPKDMSEANRVMLADHIHRSAHMIFVRWAQSHGASCV